MPGAEAAGPVVPQAPPPDVALVPQRAAPVALVPQHAAPVAGLAAAEHGGVRVNEQRPQDQLKRVEKLVLACIALVLYAIIMK